MTTTSCGGGSGSATTHNGKIAFTDGQSLAVVDPDGSDQAILARGMGDTSWWLPDWSPEGARLAVVTSATVFDEDIVVMDADGSGQRNLTERYTGVDEWDDEGPSWSPDGSRIAFTSTHEPDSGDELADLYVMEADGSNKHALTSTPSFDERDPDWSPAGDEIAYLAVGPLEEESDDLTFAIRLMNADGSGGRSLVEVRWNAPEDAWFPDFNHYRPRWSPDGTKIAFSESTKEAPAAYDSEIVVMDADGSGRTVITSEHPGNSWSPAWSPDGSKIAFVSDRDGGCALYVMAADGSEVERLAEPTGGSAGNCLAYPDWQPLAEAPPPGEHTEQQASAPVSTTKVFEEALLRALPAFDDADCVRAADRAGAFHCAMSETSGSTLTAGDRLRIVCGEKTCRFAWPIVGEYGVGGEGPVGSFACGRSCWGGAAKGYVYDLVSTDIAGTFFPTWPMAKQVELGQIESDLELREGDDVLTLEITTRDGRRASVDSMRRSADPDIHRILMVSFPGHQPPAWKPTYPRALDIGPTPSTPSTACADGYERCLPIVEDLDCSDIAPGDKPVPISVSETPMGQEPGEDQYNLDRDGDGTGCEPDEPETPKGTTYRLSLEASPGKPITKARFGDVFDLVVWSPNLPRGIRSSFWWCVNTPSGSGEVCEAHGAAVAGRAKYRGGPIGFWQVDEDQGRDGVLTISIKVDGKRVASQSVPLVP